MEELQVPSVTPVPLPPAPPVKNSLLVIMSFLLLIAVGLAGFFYWQMQRLSKLLAQYQTQPSPTPTATPDPTANWKTYTNTKYGFELKYPPNYQETEDKNNYPKSILILLKDESRFDLIVEVWDSKSEYESKYGQLGQSYGGYQLSVKDRSGKFITLFSANPDNQVEVGQIISTFKFLGQDDQVWGIKINTCCSCPTKVNRSAIGGTDGWVLYEKGKNYSGILPNECKAVVCAPCPPLED